MTIETRPEEAVNAATAVGVSEQPTNTQSTPASQHKVEETTPEVSAGSNAAAVTTNSTDTANSASVVTIASASDKSSAENESSSTNRHT